VQITAVKNYELKRHRDSGKLIKAVYASYVYVYNSPCGPPYPRVIRSKTYRGYVKPRIRQTADNTDRYI